jgi:hypothetical protein
VARKPNYRFDRIERDRAKAAKKADRLKSKQDRATNRDPADSDAADQEAETNPAGADGSGTGAGTPDGVT